MPDTCRVSSADHITPLSKLPNFDPRTVPVVGVDAHLPLVPAERLLAESLRRRFAAPPAWEPEVRAEPRFTQRKPAQAAVLLPLVARPEPTLLLTLRTSHLAHHSGQIAFPGGKVDDADSDAALVIDQVRAGLVVRMAVLYDLVAERPARDREPVEQPMEVA